MPISNYNRFPNGVNIANMNVLNTYAGNVYWVDSGTGSNGNKGTYRQPLATIDNAIGKCSANNGDIIVVFPGHSGTVSLQQLEPPFKAAEGPVIRREDPSGPSAAANQGVDAVAGSVASQYG